MNYKTDIVIAGGGMAGVSAAISAAESGADVLLVEQLSYLGGTATGGMVVPLMTGGIFSNEGKKVVSGNLDKIFEKLEEFEDAKNYNCNHEILKLALDEMMLERKVKVLFNTFICDAEKKNDSLSSIYTINKSGRQQYEAKVFIDATGDADVAYMAGIPYEMGRPADGITQATTLRFILGNVDAGKAHEYMSSKEGSVKFKEAIQRYADETGFEILDAHGFQNFIINGRSNELMFNCPRVIGVNTTDAQSLSNAYINGRKKILVYYKLLKQNIPGCENSFISYIAPFLGIRESRRIIGEYMIIAEDVLEGRKFQDGIACNSWFIDIHNPTGKGIIGSEGKRVKHQYPKGGWNDIPYRSLYSNQIKNLLVAGRCISAAHEAQAAIRIMASCIAIGQAAGTAAGMMANGNLNSDEINAAELREKLALDGALITGVNL